MSRAKYLSLLISCLMCMSSKSQEPYEIETLFFNTGEVKFFHHRTFKALPGVLENFCIRYGMYVMVAHDIKSHYEIAQYIKRKSKYTEKGYWLGWNDEREENYFVKSDRSTKLWFAWHRGEPNGGRRSNCAALYHRYQGEVDDVRCEASFYIACARKFTAPRIDYIEEIECQRDLGIRWTAGEGSVGLKHRINLQATDDSHALLVDEHVIEPGPRTSRIKGALNGKKYHIEITVCTTECCCGHLTARITTEPFVGKPSPMKNFQLTKYESACRATWDWPDDTPLSDITGVKLTLQSSKSVRLFYQEDDIDVQEVVIVDPVDEYVWTPEPGLSQVVIGQVETCTGNSDKVKASGTCRLNHPGGGNIYIPTPTLMFYKTGAALQLALSDLEGFTVSCLFVMVKPLPSDENLVSSTEGTFELSDLKAASGSPPSVESTYIAVALPKSYLGRHYEDVALGNGETTYCNTVVKDEKTGESASFLNGEGPETTFQGQNYKLKEEWSYSFYVVSTTTTGSGILSWIYGSVNLYRSASCELSGAVLAASTTVVGEEDEEEELEGEDETGGEDASSAGCIALVATAGVLGFLDFFMLGLICRRIANTGPAKNTGGTDYSRRNREKQGKSGRRIERSRSRRQR